MSAEDEPLPPPTDEWFDSEQPTRLGMIQEMQRIKLRTKARPIPVLLLALLVTGALIYKIEAKKQVVEANIVLALSDGVLARDQVAIPVTDLKDYVSTVLLPSGKLLALVDKRSPSARKRLGDDAALDGIREQIEITVWKNSYLYYDEDDPNAAHSARIGIQVSDTDPDLAFEIATDVTQIILQTAQEEMHKNASQLVSDTVAFRKGLEDRMAELTAQSFEKQQALDEARQADKRDVVHALELVTADLDAERLKIRAQLDAISKSSDTYADRISDANLDTTLTIVEEHRPERPVQRGFVLAMVLTVVAIGVLFGAAVFVGSFDSRIHDTDDVERLGLPILGHVPGFPGDQVGSLRARGVTRGRVPSFRRWRSRQ